MKDIVKNLCNKLNNEWALLTAGDKKKFNSMTISWGSFGVLWFKNVVTVYVRPERYTLEFLKKQEYFTVSFYNSKYKKDLQILGTKSGRDTNKMKEISLTPKFLDNSITFEQASQTFVCKKLYMGQLNLNQMDEQTREQNYQTPEGHYVFVGEIQKII